MNKHAAINLVETTFEHPFDKDRFSNFARNLFHSFESASFIYRGNYIPDAYKKQIKTLERIGKYEDPEGNKIDILAVCISQESTLERARTLQRNFISWYLNGSRGDIAKDAALVAFYVEGSTDWRLSLVKMEYRLDKTEAGRLKTFTELTPAKRFSFLVGKNENTHTAQRQLLPILQREDVPPTLTDLEKAFSVEVVTKEFFEKYKQLFLDTKEALDKIIEADPQIQSDFKEKNIETVDFTKKLLGQIVFLYFLQKKGWFGVARDADWGSGPKEFLRLLFEKNIVDYDNYFNDILEPLFYEALAIERSGDFYSRFNCKIPFLNGGLFDPLNNYDWVHTDIHLPNHLFSNDYLTKEGDKGTGILDVFDRYNFTVKEDEPLEREVAVDPEMLGKVFENLLEVKDRKSKGTYYTPREIVHYMCQESLINYLVTELGGKVKKEDIETLVQIGEAAVEHDTRVTELGTETETYSYKLPASVRQHAKAIDEALLNIRVCDPAVGSGAFLVGMMTEIIRVRNTISSYLPEGDRSIYTFKHHAIQNSLYGVDIDPGATEIAKLRLWLSLIVDEQDIKSIKPLPNLDYKIMQGNSLLEEYEGIKLFDEELFKKSPFDNSALIEETKEKFNELQSKFLELYRKNELQGAKKDEIEKELKKYSNKLKRLTKTPKLKTENRSLFDQASEAQEKAKELKRLHGVFFDTAQKKEKDRIKKQIETLTWELIEATLREQGKASKLSQIEKFKKNNVKPFFLWKLNFSEVFEKNKGFDIVIANPPYIKESVNKHAFDGVRNTQCYQGKMDIWYLFGSLALDILREEGVMSFIATNNWVTNDGASKFRNKVIEYGKVINFIDFGAYKVFTAGIQTMVVILTKSQQPSIYTLNYGRLTNNEATFDELSEFLKENNEVDNESYKKYPVTLDRSEYKNTYISFIPSHIGKILQKIKKNAGFNLRDDEVFSGIDVLQDFVSKRHIEKLDASISVGEGIFVLSEDEKNSIIWNSNELELIKPYYTTKEIKRYYANSKNNYWIIYTSGSVNSEIDKYPNIKSHLDKFKKILTSVNKPYGLHRTRDENIFLGEKILATRKCATPTFSLVDFPSYVSRTFLVIKSDRINLKFLLAILNSKLVAYWLYYKGKLQGNQYQIDKVPVTSIPISTANKSLQSELIQLVEQLLVVDPILNKNKASKFESKIDQLVYELYDLSPEEIAIVENEI